MVFSLFSPLNVFQNGKLPMKFKHTLLTLVPKFKHASEVLDYKTISLCKFFYKVVAKILANHLKHVLPLIIHESQSAFIIGRDITDNISLAHDLGQDLLSSSKKDLFMVKINLQIAFDLMKVC